MKIVFYLNQMMMLKRRWNKFTASNSSLKSKLKSLSKEKDSIDKAAEELFERCQMYESQWDQMFRQQENINEIIREIENEWKERLDAKEREVVSL